MAGKNFNIATSRKCGSELSCFACRTSVTPAEFRII